MKKNIFFLFFSFLFCKNLSAQVLCVQCYNQNARVLTDTNNLILNGGFENTNCTPFDSTFCPNALKYNCDIDMWKCTGGGPNTYACIFDPSLSTIPEGNKAVYFGNYGGKFCSAVQGDTSCIVSKGCEIKGIPNGYPVSYSGFGDTNGVSLEQTIMGLNFGNIYGLEFWAGGESKCSCLYSGIFAIDLGFGKIFLRDPVTAPTTSIGIRYVIIFAATSNSHTVKFTNWGHFGTRGTELILDDVRLFQIKAGSNPCESLVYSCFDNDAMNVFPNPATNLLTITTTTSTESEIILYDIASRKLLQQKFSGTVSLDVENFSKGIYFYQVRDEKGMVGQGKVVKE